MVEAALVLKGIAECTKHPAASQGSVSEHKEASAVFVAIM